MLDPPDDRPRDSHDGSSSSRSDMNGRTDFAPPCLSLDLEVNPKNERIQAIGAVRGDDGRTLTARVSNNKTTAEKLARLDDLADGASFILGHNIIEFDLTHLVAAKPDLKLLTLPVVDTLRLSPLAFPANPYHALVKHYKTGAIKRHQLNDPELDARLALDVYYEQIQELKRTNPTLLTALHWLATPDPQGTDRALDELFRSLRRSKRPTDEKALQAITKRLAGAGCETKCEKLVREARGLDWTLAYALSWLSVAGGDSVLPPWVRHQFPETMQILRDIRDTACTKPDCQWCRERHDARKELRRWFGFDQFREYPKTDGEQSMQQAIIEESMAGKHVLGILPTGTGKTLCYQLPALSRYDKIGALTVVISPLVALMADQVAGMERHGIDSCVTINGMLSMPERSDALDRVRLGNASIVLVSPEQLRSITFRRALEQREIGAWVLDEAHCLSRWGHDFRPDYRYISRFIKESAGKGPIPPIMCLTATARLEVIDDIKQHFREKLDIRLSLFNGGAERENLTFEVVPTTDATKLSDIHQVLQPSFSDGDNSGAIIFCATRRHTEEISGYLQSKGVKASHFHAGLLPDTKREVQNAFIDGDLRTIAATNAFGMGIDKPDVRLVVHADIPSSLENYLQEAGRAGRDLEPARCILLYNKDDVEKQFGMSAYTRLTRGEIHGVLRALRRLNFKNHGNNDVVATPGEILLEDEDSEFQRDKTTDDTRVKTAVAWLEESQLLTREQNRVQIFPASLLVETIEQVREKLEKQPISAEYREKLMKIAQAIIEADVDDGISTDELMVISGLSPKKINSALYDLEQAGVANNDTVLTAYVHVGVKQTSKKRLAESTDLEVSLICRMSEAAPDQEKGKAWPLHLRTMSQSLREDGVTDPLPERLVRILRSIALDGKGENGSAGSIRSRKRDAETYDVTLIRTWKKLEETAKIRRDAAQILLDHLLGQLPHGSRGANLLVDTTVGKLLRAINSDLILKSKIKDPVKLMERALLWLHEQEVIRLNKGLTVFRQAMTIRLDHDMTRGFANPDYEPLSMHYKEQVLQIHVMAEYAQLGLSSITDAQRLAMNYFSMENDEFLQRWLPGRDKEIGRQTTPESWRAIVEHLSDPRQQRIVADNRENTNVLVLAGPGSGKTRVLVHRIAYLVRVRRENPRGIVALTYNRHAAVDVKRRLARLIGDEAKGVTILTCHALAMRLAGYTFVQTAGETDDAYFREIIQRATKLLRGEDLEAEEADQWRERLLAGFRWILVDEYQDIGANEYELISALAGRTLQDESSKLNLFAVGDDDQNIYAFNGTSVEFIRRFERDYKSKTDFLIHNYRSTAHIIAAGNSLIAPAAQRMKTNRPILINRARSKDPAGGVWEKRDPVAQGRVHVLRIEDNPVRQAQAIIAELQRLASLSRDWKWSRCAVITRKWRLLDPVRVLCESYGIPAQMANEEPPSFWRLRETRSLVEWLRSNKPDFTAQAVRAWLKTQPQSNWNALLKQAIDEFSASAKSEDSDLPVDHFIEWLAEWGRETYRSQRGLLLLTAHRAKGLEFDHVAILGGGWHDASKRNEPDEDRRLYYVAMTRAKQTLALAQTYGTVPLLDDLRGHPSVIWRSPGELPPAPADISIRYIRPTLKEVNIGYAGRFASQNQTHDAIRALSPGDSLRTHVVNGRWDLLDRSGRRIGQMAKSFKPPPGMHCRSAAVRAIIVWDRDSSVQSGHEAGIKCDEWEVVVPEFVFEPEPPG